MKGWVLNDKIRNNIFYFYDYFFVSCSLLICYVLFRKILDLKNVDRLSNDVKEISKLLVRTNKVG